MKVSKEYTERRNEILDVAEQLFAIKGYSKCTIIDILEAVGIAKGTFYYYFKSKEEVLDAIIERVTQMIVAKAQATASIEQYSPADKMLHVFLSMRVESSAESDLMQELHKPENALMHQKSLSMLVTRVTPILVGVVNEGIDAGVFRSDFPREYMQIFLTAASTLLDEGIFQVKPEEQLMTIRALISLLEKMLGVPDGSFWSKAEQHWG